VFECIWSWIKLIILSIEYFSLFNQCVANIWIEVWPSVKLIGYCLFIIAFCLFELRFRTYTTAFPWILSMCKRINSDMLISNWALEYFRFSTSVPRLLVTIDSSKIMMTDLVIILCSFCVKFLINTDLIVFNLVIIVVALLLLELLRISYKRCHIRLQFRAAFYWFYWNIWWCVFWTKFWHFGWIFPFSNSVKCFI